MLARVHGVLRRLAAYGAGSVAVDIWRSLTGSDTVERKVVRDRAGVVRLVFLRHRKGVELVGGGCLMALKA